MQNNKTPNHIWDGSYPPGLVGEIARWIDETAYMSLPILSTAAALSVVSTVCGRHIIGPTGSSTALYSIMLAPTGAGKDHPLKSASRILHASQLACHVGPSGFMSRTALVASIIEKPCQLTSIDEIGDFIAKINSPKSSQHELGVSAFLRELWSSGLDAVQTPEWAGKSSETIYAPHLTLLGAATPRQFYSGLNSAAIENGSLNRFLIFSADQRGGLNENRADEYDVPESIIDGVRRVYEMTAGNTNMPTRTLSTFNPLESQCYSRIPWEDSAVEHWFRGCRTALDFDLDKDPAEAENKARRLEHAVRLATIVSVGRSSRCVTIEDLILGLKIANTSEEFILDGVRNHVSENETQARAQKVFLAIKKRGGSAKRRDIHQSLRRSINSRELTDVLTHLVDAGEVSASITPSGKGPAVTMYSIIQKAA